MAITASDVKELRERTGCGMMDCKSALTEANGDMDKAIELLREKGLAKAAKKAGRVAAEGLVKAVVDGNVGAVVEINSETDFVAKNADFIKLVDDVLAIIIKENPADVEALLALPYEDGKNVEEVLKEKIATIGENMNLRRFSRFEGAVGSYVHGGGRIGVVVQFKLADDSKKDTDTFKEYAKDIAMQVAAANPLYVTRDEVPSDVIEKEKEILKAQAINEGKPEAIAEKMVLGRIGKYYNEFCVVEQGFIKDPDITVADYTKQIAGEIGTDIEILSFVRFEKGDGIEKKEDNFADEVASMVK
ncbi:MAG: translation elongation factor Ts [Eubacteriales bacterium]|nr:translation elongation factor Ts [Eubacteriales bacterium]